MQNQIPILLKRQGRSMYWLAKNADVTYKVIHKLVQAPTIPDRTSYQTLRGVANALGVGIDDLEQSEPVAS